MKDEEREGGVEDKFPNVSLDRMELLNTSHKALSGSKKEYMHWFLYKEETGGYDSSPSEKYANFKRKCQV
ncbi:hypothetical protein ACLOJK_010597 [Asimina triloba]